MGEFGVEVEACPLLAVGWRTKTKLILNSIQVEVVVEEVKVVCFISEVILLRMSGYWVAGEIENIAISSLNLIEFEDDIGKYGINKIISRIIEK